MGGKVAVVLVSLLVLCWIFESVSMLLVKLALAVDFGLLFGLMVLVHGSLVATELPARNRPNQVAGWGETSPAVDLR